MTEIPPKAARDSMQQHTQYYAFCFYFYCVVLSSSLSGCRPATGMRAQPHRTKAANRDYLRHWTTRRAPHRDPEFVELCDVLQHLSSCSL